VLADDEVRALACALGAIHLHFQPILDHGGLNRIFALQVAWKLARGTRALTIKQACPQPFGHVDVPNDCRGH
jgi:hypothetical protein